jgi:hypothetical protein
MNGGDVCSVILCLELLVVLLVLSSPQFSFVILHFSELIENAL